MTTEVTSRVCGDKRRTNKRTTPASEALSGILRTDQIMQEAVKTSHRARQHRAYSIQHAPQASEQSPSQEVTEEEETDLEQLDSLYDHTLPNLTTQYAQNLAISPCKACHLFHATPCRCAQYRYCNVMCQISDDHQCKSRKRNVANNHSNPRGNNVKITNSKLYRKEPSHLREEESDSIVPHQDTKRILIKNTKRKSEQILKPSPAEIHAKKNQEIIEKCTIWQENKMRGMHLVRMQQEQNQKESELAELPKGTTSKKRKAKIQTHEGIRTRYKMTKQTTSLRYRERAVIDRFKYQQDTYQQNRKLQQKQKFRDRNKSKRAFIQSYQAIHPEKSNSRRHDVRKDCQKERRIQRKTTPPHSQHQNQKQKKEARHKSRKH